MIAPITPHIAEELWEINGGNSSVFLESYPEYNPIIAEEDTINIAVQVNGKLRANIDVDLNTTQKEIEKLALKHDNIKKHIEGKEVNRLIYIPSKLLNIVVS